VNRLLRFSQRYRSARQPQHGGSEGEYSRRTLERGIVICRRPRLVSNSSVAGVAAPGVRVPASETWVSDPATKSPFGYTTRACFQTIVFVGQRYRAKRHQPLARAQTAPASGMPTRARLDHRGGLKTRPNSNALGPNGREILRQSGGRKDGNRQTFLPVFLQCHEFFDKTIRQ